MGGTMQQLIEEAGEPGNLSIAVRIYDGDRYAGVDVDVRAMAAVLFCGAVVEEVILFADGLHGDRSLHYGSDRLKQRLKEGAAHPGEHARILVPARRGVKAA